MRVIASRALLILATSLLAAACASSSPPPDGASPSLEGTSWRLVKFRGGDGKTLVPDDPAKYTLDLNTDGSLVARIDCNRGRGIWRSAGASHLELGPMALTRAQCPPGSLHDRIVKDWSFLALMADGGINELEPRR
jgi:para-nitrobenzyl esterase